jgi:hypothetical protein
MSLRRQSLYRNLLKQRVTVKRIYQWKKDRSNLPYVERKNLKFKIKKMYGLLTFSHFMLCTLISVK